MRSADSSDDVDVVRRDVLKLLLAAPLAPFAIFPADIERATAAVHEELVKSGQFRPRFFNADEWRTVRVLADLVIPRDERSGSASDAGVPEFMDFILREYDAMQTWMRDGLAWLDAESNRRFTKRFAATSRAQQTAILDDIAWPKLAPDEFKDGVAFFSRFRDLSASGFWTSRMGVRDLRYMGNTALAAWPGCPPAVLRKLGVSYKRA
ncbi:MAG: hypothetical protein MNPFHGCM_00036 [Gemmatimonadaceae bacterium]|nr:hypothetical protein [Gemmatimonadaceae bacterium]